MDTTATSIPEHATLVRGMSARDATLLIIGGIIGSAIFLTPQDVAQQMRTPLLFLLVWAAGGVVTFMAGLSFAELGAMYPEAGGQYIYLREAFGDFAAFLYGWLMFVAGSSGGIAAITVAFAEYLGKAFPAVASEKVLASFPGFTVHARHIVSRSFHLTVGDVLSVSAIVVLTAINVRGLRPGVILQNVSTWLKYAALAIFVLLGFTLGHGHWSNLHFAGGLTQILHPGLHAFLSAMGVAFIAVFWCYDGWVFVAWTSGEIKDPQRSIPRALVLGILGVIAIYLLMDAVYLYAMPLGQIASTEAVGEVAARSLFSPFVAWLLALVIAISCFGAAGCNILSGARVSYAMGRDGLFFRRMANVHPTFRTPSFALVTQAIVACLIAVSGTYEQAFTYTMFGLVLSYVAAVVALIVLRRTRPALARPYQCPLYPWLPLAYIALIGGWLLNTLIERPIEALACIALMALGIPWYLYWKRTM
jgi:APA family basic amino acid/polyamine antiporter